MVMVRAGFGVEGRLQASNPSAEPHYHLSDDVIRPDPESRTSDLQRQVPIAEVPGNAQQVWRFGSLDFDDRLWGSADPQITATVEFEAVAVEQVMRPRQVE
jgi:hypothetical protein